MLRWMCKVTREYDIRNGTYRLGVTQTVKKNVLRFFEHIIMRKKKTEKNHLSVM